MDFDQMLETWRAQNTAPPYDVNRIALRQALQSEEARVRGELRSRRRGLWFVWIFYTGLVVWAGLWIAITITNGWPTIYAIAAGVSFGIFAFGVGATWVSRGPRREPPRNFGNTLQEEVRRNLALVDHELSFAKHSIIHVLGAVSLVPENNRGGVGACNSIEPHVPWVQLVHPRDDHWKLPSTLTTPCRSSSSSSNRSRPR